MNLNLPYLMHEQSPLVLKRQNYIIQPSAMISVFELGELNNYDLLSRLEAYTKLLFIKE